MRACKLSRLNIFISTSITQKVGLPQQIAKLRTLVEAIDMAAESRGAVTTCAFRTEKWKGEEKPSIFVPRDLQWCRECDGAIIIPENSGGVLVEQGWLSLLGKPMLRLYENAVINVSALVENLNELAPVFDRVFTNTTEATRHVSQFVDFLYNKMRVEK